MTVTVENAHQREIEDILASLGGDPERGLAAEEAARRLAEDGPNELERDERISALSMLLKQFRNVLILILVVAAALSAFLGHGLEAVAIAAIVLFAVGLSFIQEYRADRAIEALMQMAAPTAAVVRAGREMQIPTRDVVVGDLVLLKAGDRIPADARLIEAINLRAEEAALTGESVPVEKETAALRSGGESVGDRKNMVYSGTLASYGRGRAIVTATGMRTEFGKITGMLGSVKTAETPLQKNLDRVGRLLARAALVIVAVIVGLGIWRGQPIMEMLVFGIALAVAVVPEALPAVVTISLAIGVQRMVKRRALVRRLPIVETLGSTTVICSDKTGTLTRDEMTVRKAVAGLTVFEVTGTGYEPRGEFLREGAATEPSPELESLLRALALASDARLVHEEGRWELKGDPTEGALIAAAAKAGLSREKLEKEYSRTDEIPFTSEAKRMTTLNRHADGTIAFAKGALEVILDASTRYLASDGERKLDDGRRRRILETAHGMAGEAMRVLAAAQKETVSLKGAESGMTFLGFVGMIDPPRAEARDAIALCAEAGIAPVMITGDHPLTAKTVARELGMLRSGRVVTGAELEAMSDKELTDAVEEIEVYARVSPAHKLRVVEALQSKGHVVAMTGDGVNDAPALKKADIGVAMGITGTDVSKEVAGMTLTDDNFASIVGAVEEGRHIFANIKKYLMYLLSSNIGEIGLMAGTTLLGMPLPLTAVQILTVNLATDGLPALALAVDPPEKGLMSRKPRRERSGIFTRPVVILMLAGGIWSSIVNLGIFAWALGSGMSVEKAMTMTFVSLVLIQFFKAYNYRSDRESVLVRPFANRWLNLAVFGEFLLLGAIVYVPILQGPFGTFALSLRDWIVVLLAALTVVPVLEATKWGERRGWFGPLD